MKRIFVINFFNFIYIIIFCIISLFSIKNYNISVFHAYSIALLLLIFILIIGNIISKFIFNFRIEKHKLKIININNFNKKNIKNSIIISIITLLILFSTFYLFLYYKNNLLLDKFPISLGIKNSCSYIFKIFFISIPLYAFEVTYLEYCVFLNSIKIPIINKFVKLFFYIIIQVVFQLYFYFNGFLYAKIAIDIFFFAYYIIKLRDIIKLCNLKI